MRKRYLILLFIIIFIPRMLFAKINDVAFITQVPPGDWENTLNCGQTSYYMALSYLNNVTSEDDLDFNEIKNIDDWLYKKYNDPIRDYNGYYTTVNKINTLAKERNNIKTSEVFTGEGDAEKLKQEIDLGNIIIPAVRINMSASKEGHFMVLIGYDDKYFYFHDPGKLLGRKRKYLVKDFLDTWKTQNYSYVVIRREKEIEKVEQVETRRGVSVPIENVSVPSVNKKVQVSNASGTYEKPIDKEIQNASSILLNKTIQDENNITQTVVKDNGDQLQIITVDAELEENKFPFLDENNWMHLDDNLIIDYNVPKEVSKLASEQVEEENEEPDVEGYGYGEGDNSQIQNFTNSQVEGYGYGTEDQFEFANNYENGRLIIPLFWTTENNNFVFDLDYKIDDGSWINILGKTTLLNYDYYVKKNNHKYTFRLRSFDGEKHSEYKKFEFNINLDVVENNSTMETIDGDAVLGENNTYFCDYCILNENINLLVEKNVKIKMNKSSSFVFSGNVFFMGEEGNNIFIMPNNNDNKAGDFGFIYFYGNKFVEFNYVDVGYGGYVSFPGEVGDMMKIDKVKSLLINNSYFHDTYVASGANVNIIDSVVNVRDSKFSKSLYGFRIASSSGEIINNEFSDNHYNVMIYNVNNNLKIYNNKILNGISLAVLGQNILADFKDNIFLNNRSNLITMMALNVESGEVTLSKEIYNIYEAHIDKNATLDILPGTIFKSNHDYGRFYIDGKINVSGTATDPVIFTSFYDDSIGGDSNNDKGIISPATGDWGFIELDENSYGSTINNAIFKYGGNYSFPAINHGMVYINGAKNVGIKNSLFDQGFYNEIEIINGENINIENNKIQKSLITGIGIKDSSFVDIKNNEISFNKIYGVLYENSKNINILDNIFNRNGQDYLEIK